jgi:hypothetical protein
MDFIAGLGGREINMEAIRHIVEKMERASNTDAHIQEPYWVGLDPTILPKGA